ncbi:MAG TPA: aldo/keto reductase, partial [Rhodanobacter sp.]|nr:aldo/keto reductase [Rhodanobacter sp.]
MQLAGPSVFGPPKDHDAALAVLREAVASGVNHIDTSDFYGPHITNTLIREALHPYPGMLVATKAGLARSGPDQWQPLGRPEYLRQQALKSLRWLGVEQIGLWQLHRIDNKVPRDEQFGAIKALLDEGIIAHAGLSEVSVDDVVAASAVFPVATVQNRYNLVDRGSEDVLDHCETHGIGFIPWYPLAAGSLAGSGGLLDRIANAHGATPSQVALAWLLRRSPVMLPIPGTSKVSHLEQNVAAAGIELSDAEFAELDAGGKAEFSAAGPD